MTENGYLLSDNKLILTGNNKPSKFFREHVKYKQLGKDIQPWWLSGIMNSKFK